MLNIDDERTSDLLQFMIDFVYIDLDEGFHYTPIFDF